MKIEIIQVGKDKDAWVQEATHEYLKRLQAFADVVLVTVKEERGHDDVTQITKREGERIIEKLKEGYLQIALDVQGGAHDSHAFADMLERLRDQEGGKVQFIIGGAFGLSDEVRLAVHRLISLSAMTFTHQLIRVMLLEQVYRGFSLLKGSGYHK